MNYLNSTFNTLFDDIFYSPSNLKFNFNDTTNTFRTNSGHYETKLTDEGLLVINVVAVGHDKKDIVIDVTENIIKIKSEKPENSPMFVKNIDLSFKVNEEFDGTTTKVTFDNGLLVLTVDKREERKAKRIKLS